MRSSECVEDWIEGRVDQDILKIIGKNRHIRMFRLSFGCVCLKFADVSLASHMASACVLQGEGEVVGRVRGEEGRGKERKGKGGNKNEKGRERPIIGAGPAIETVLIGGNPAWPSYTVPED